MHTWCWERLKAGGEGDDLGWDGWIVSPTQWTWVWANFGRWWRTGKPGVLQSMGVTKSQIQATESNNNNSAYIITSLSIHACVGPWVVSISWLLWMVWWLWECKYIFDILSSFPLDIQSSLCIRRFSIYGFSQLWIENIQGKNNSEKFQKAKLEFAARQHLFT